MAIINNYSDGHTRLTFWQRPLSDEKATKTAKSTALDKVALVMQQTFKLSKVLPTSECSFKPLNFRDIFYQWLITKAFLKSRRVQLLNRRKPDSAKVAIVVSCDLLCCCAANWFFFYDLVKLFCLLCFYHYMVNKDYQSSWCHKVSHIVKLGYSFAPSQ